MGLANSSANSTKHGLLANTICMPQEDKAAFDRLLDAYMTEWDPHGPTEEHYVRALALNEWREYRIGAYEAGIVGTHAGRQSAAIDRDFETADRATRMALAFEEKAESGVTLALLGRYDARINRHYRYALKELRRLQSERAKLPNDPGDLAENKPTAASQASRPTATRHSSLATESQ